MQEATAKVKKSRPVPQKIEKAQTEPRQTRRYGARQSELTKQVSSDDIVKKVLAAPVTISVQEALGASRNISESIQEML